MGEISAGLIRKLEQAGLTDAEKQVLAIAIMGDGGDGAEVEGFGQRDIGLPAPSKLGNFEIQDLMVKFDLAEVAAGRHGVIVNHEEQ